MKKMKKIALTICFVIHGCLLFANCISGQNAEAGRQKTLAPDAPNAAGKEQPAPVLEINVAPENSFRKSLKVHWKISNPGSQSIFIYAALLRPANNGFIEFKPDVSGKTLEIRLTRLSKIPVEPNYFPAAEFQEIAAGKSLEGDFATRYTLLEAINDSRSEKAVKAAQIAGRWSVRAVFGYGTETDSVKQALAGANGKHPINSIVEWQKTIVSPAVKSTFK